MYSLFGITSTLSNHVFWLSYFQFFPAIMIVSRFAFDFGLFIVAHELVVAYSNSEGIPYLLGSINHFLFVSFADLPIFSFISLDVANKSGFSESSYILRVLFLSCLGFYAS